MPDIKDSVGENGRNQAHDVAIVQAMLVLVKNAKQAPYLESYDGLYGKYTKNAIVAFQKDHIFVSRPGYMDAGAGRAQAVADAKPGLVQPKDATFKRLVELLPATYKDMRTVENTRTVFMPADEAGYKASRQAVVTNVELETAFRGKVATLIDEMYQTHKIVLWVTPPWAAGTRRTFQKQYDLMFQIQDGKPVTSAGPGESNHNFGQAVDIGFKALRWIAGNGTVVEDEDWWLHKLAKAPGGPVKATQLWTVMREVATTGGAGLFRGPAADWPHVQAWNDAGLDMATRLAALLSAVGDLRWTGMAQRYKCDFGLGGAFYNVGTAKQIWSGHGLVDKADLALARTQALKKAAIAAGPQSAAWKKFAPVAAVDIKAAEVSAMQAALKKDFAEADQNWAKWKAY